MWITATQSCQEVIQNTNNVAAMPLVPVLSAARAFDPRRENAHPLFDPSRFASNIDYYGAIYDSAVLATRLMNTPQALQHDYCFYNGKNRLANDPAKYVPSDFSNGPCLYACDKAIGELDETDIRHVEHQRLRLAERVRFRVTDLGANTVGLWWPCDNEDGVAGNKSIIEISRTLIYNKILAPGQSPEDKLRLKFLLTCTLLHEVAHAAHNHDFGGAAFEEFRENSVVSEAGFEYESRIFGQKPSFLLDAPNPNDRISWGIWQSHGSLSPGYKIDELVRNAWQMPKNPQIWAGGLDFVTKLFDDDFWEGETSEYAERGALALIPDGIAFCCISGRRDNMAKSIPLSIRDLFRSEGPSYAKKKYARSANPYRKLRGFVKYDNCGQAIL